MTALEPNSPDKGSVNTGSVNRRLAGVRSVTVRAPAKINLDLRILAREETGFHQIETLFQAIEFYDTVSIELAEGGQVFLKVDTTDTSYGVSDSPSRFDLGPTTGNLVYRAAQAFLAEAKLGSGLKIKLTKVIPSGAGLGGGSSDAAATLRGLAALFPGAIGFDQLVGIAGSLGSDVPFFLSSSGTAWGWGRGDRILPVPALPVRTLVLALPDVGLATPEVYRRLAAFRRVHGATATPRLHPSLNELDWDHIDGSAVNDFEPVAFEMVPSLRKLFEGLIRTDAGLVRMSGSGSSFYALFPDHVTASSALTELEPKFPSVQFRLVVTAESLPKVEVSDT